jgi:hypothetical protein
MRPPRRILLPLLALLTAACGAPAPAAVPAPLSDQARAEAIAALSGGGRGPLLSEEDIQEVAHGLEAIRVRDPVLRRVSAWPHVVEIDVRDHAAVRLPGSERRRDTVMASTGIASIDSVSRELQVADVAISWSNGTTVRPRFTRPVNAAAAQAMYERLPEVQLPLPEIAGGNSTAVGVRFSEGVIHYHFSVSWGDCMAGCIHHHGWHYTWDPRTGSVRRMSETGAPLETLFGPPPAGG